MLKVIELFAGIGSQHQALKNINIPHEVVAISEIDKFALKSYTALHGTPSNLGDITAISKLPPADLWTCSFPCQDLSLCGAQVGITPDSRSGLLLHVGRLLQTAAEHGELPKYLLMENVKNLLSRRHIAAFRAWVDKLNMLGYYTYYDVLNAADYDIPQNRERVFAVSILSGEYYRFPRRIFLSTTMQDYLEHTVDEKYFISNTMQHYFKSTNFVMDKRRIQRGAICDCLLARDSKGPKCIVVGSILMPGRHIRNGRVLSPDGCSATLTAKRGGDDVVKIQTQERIRCLTPREYFRLMGWTDTQIDKIQRAGISDTQQYKQAGNGICVPLLEKIFTNLIIPPRQWVYEDINIHNYVNANQISIAM